MGLNSKQFGFAFLVVAFTALLCIQGTSAQEEIQCLGQDLNMTAKQLAVITDCLAENKISSIWKIPMERLSCFGICILERKNLLTDKGTLDHDKIYKYILDVMKPDKVKQPIVDGVEKCIKDHGVAVKVMNDPNCMTFMEVGQCVHDVFFSYCVEG